MTSAATNPKVDAYIGRAAEFARPILKHLRGLVHTACPDVEEEIKWSRPFFVYKGVIVANMSAFKAHCSFGFWGAEIGEALRADGVLQDGGMGSLGRITSLADLPAQKRLLGYLRQAVAAIDAGRGETVMAVQRRVVKAPRADVAMPEELAAALTKHTKAAAVFAGFSPSCRQEYVEWIADAKRTETRERRTAEAVTWIAEGKQRNWKYQDC